MKASSRNSYSGKVTRLESGTLSTEVEIQLESGEKLYAQVTRPSSQKLGLEPGKNAVALVKAAEIMLVTEADDYILSCRNQFAGKIVKLTRGFVSSEILIQTPSGLRMNAVISLEGTDRMALEEGSPVVAMFKTSSVVLAVKK
ncbi:TOBE domain-containing protein [uncultured Mailhella sp.]|uniref:TOBE domain-containing protein n=1 Tax=uncultured Mailhella sp. TaxID=1981031 RepID=UPI00261DD707|nr:TOBE domain-containing protein [uncultured Mailhella sp.]